MVNKNLYALLLIIISSSSVADVVVSPDNEDICKQKYVREVFDQQVQYSNSQNTEQVRRTAERHIDRSREVYNETNSFCSALSYLNNKDSDDYLNDFKHSKSGESQLK